jgi:hypothetical protein
MKIAQLFGSWTALVLSTLLGLTACTYDAALRHLSPTEQAEFALYHHRMTGRQEYIYLAKASAAERTAYLREIGLVQRFEALDPQDRAAVQAGWPRVGMSAEALRFVWGEPYHPRSRGSGTRRRFLTGIQAKKPTFKGLWQCIENFPVTTAVSKA